MATKYDNGTTDIFEDWSKFLNKLHFLVQTLLARQQQTIFCFPYPHLQSFYQRMGFKLLILQQAPTPIQQRFNGYTQQRELLCMVYHAQ